MTVWQRAAARLRQVADQDAGPAGGLGGERREALEELDQLRMAPIAVARVAHHLPVRPVDRQLDAALQAAARVIADRLRLADARQLHPREQRLGRDRHLGNHRPLLRQWRIDDGTGRLFRRRCRGRLRRGHCRLRRRHWHNGLRARAGGQGQRQGEQERDAGNHALRSSESAAACQVKCVLMV
jgi:hypothetical protein